MIDMPPSALEASATSDTNGRCRSLAIYRVKRECERIEEALNRVGEPNRKSMDTDDAEDVEGLLDFKVEEEAQKHALLVDACEMFAIFADNNRHLLWNLFKKPNGASGDGVKWKPFPWDLLQRKAMEALPGFSADDE